MSQTASIARHLPFPLIQIFWRVDPCADWLGQKAVALYVLISLLSVLAVAKSPYVAWISALILSLGYLQNAKVAQRSAGESFRVILEEFDPGSFLGKHIDRPTL